MITAGEASAMPSTWRCRRWLSRRRAGRCTAVTDAEAPVTASPAPPEGGGCLDMAAPPPAYRLGALVDQRLRGLLAGRLRAFDVAGEDGLVDHLDPGAVVVIEDRVLDDAVGRLALGHHLAED